MHVRDGMEALDHYIGTVPLTGDDIDILLLEGTTEGHLRKQEHLVHTADPNSS